MMLIYFAVLIGVMFFPMRLAAQFADAEDTSYKQTFIVVVIVAIVQFILIRFVFSGVPFVGSLVTVIVTVMIGMKLFNIPSSNFLMFGGLFLALNFVTQMIAGLVIAG